MEMRDLSRELHAVQYSLPNRPGRPVSRFYASNTMSDLIAHASSETLLVTALNNTQLVRVAELMDVPGICLAAGAKPSPDLLSRAGEAGMTILASPLSFDDAVSALRRRLGLPEGSEPQ